MWFLSCWRRLVHCECASSWFKWLFRVSPIFVCEDCGNQDWLTAFSPGVVVHVATSAAFLLFSFFNHIVLDSIMCLFPIGMLVLRNSIIFIFGGVISRSFPSGRSLSSFIVRSPFLVFGIESSVGFFSFSLRRGCVRGRYGFC